MITLPPPILETKKTKDIDWVTRHLMTSRHSVANTRSIRHSVTRHSVTRHSVH